jgi:outer membrane protein assembly factor BamB
MEQCVKTQYIRDFFARPRARWLLVTFLILLLVSGCTGTTTVPKGWSGATVSNGNLFIASMAGKLVELSTDNGSILWSVQMLMTAPSSGLGCAPGTTALAIYGSPAVSDNLVYVGGYDGKVYAFPPGRSEPKWVYPRQGSIGGHIVGGLLATQSKIFFGAEDQKVYALDGSDGYSVWESPFSTGGKIWSTPAIDGDTLYIGSFDKKLYAINTNTGKAVWEKPFKTEGAIVSTPVVHNGKVYIGSFDRRLYAVDATNGKQIWQFPTVGATKNKPENWFWAKPVIYDNTIYAPCLDHKIYILNAETGDEVADAVDLGSPVSSSPAISDNMVIVADESGKVHFIDTGTNQESRQPVDLKQRVDGPLSISTGVVYVHATNDVVYAIEVATGSVREFPLK